MKNDDLLIYFYITKMILNLVLAVTYISHLYRCKGTFTARSVIYSSICISILYCLSDTSRGMSGVYPLTKYTEKLRILDLYYNIVCTSYFILIFCLKPIYRRKSIEIINFSLIALFLLIILQLINDSFIYIGISMLYLTLKYKVINLVSNA